MNNPTDRLNDVLFDASIISSDGLDIIRKSRRAMLTGLDSEAVWGIRKDLRNIERLCENIRTTMTDLRLALAIKDDYL